MSVAPSKIEPHVCWITTKLTFPRLRWAELLHILSFLSFKELYLCGCLHRSGFINIFLRMRSARKAPPSPYLFLSSNLDHERVLLVSYPRSGNSLLRKLIERNTGILTGSDSRTNRPLSASLLECGFRGEGVMDGSVWVVKSHYPERLGYLKCIVKRVLLIVRNPFDCLESYYYMGMTNTHDKKLNTQEFMKLQYIWKDFLTNEYKVWNDFHEFWLDKIDKSVPIQIVRYEDLLRDEESTMQQVITFLHRGKAPIGWQRFAPPSAVGPSAVSATIGYAPKQGGVGKSLLRMSPEQTQEVAAGTADMMTRLGYELCSPGQAGQVTAAIGLLPLRQPATVQSAAAAGMMINDTAVIRSPDDSFGRRFTDLRRGLTDHDRRPLQTE